MSGSALVTNQAHTSTLNFCQTVHAWIDHVSRMRLMLSVCKCPNAVWSCSNPFTNKSKSILCHKNYCSDKFFIWTMLFQWSSLSGRCSSNEVLYLDDALLMKFFIWTMLFQWSSLSGRCSSNEVRYLDNTRAVKFFFLTMLVQRSSLSW